MTDPIPLSALEHTAFCSRQCALIHLEQTFEENLFTLKGHANHRRVDIPVSERLHGVRYEFAFPLWSERLNLTGRGDLVEFHDHQPLPVEYKSGKMHKKLTDPERIQLCAQALCLEEMFGLPVPNGAIYWAGSHRRVEVALDETLRDKTHRTIAETLEILSRDSLPVAVNDARCTHCSLKEACMPEIVTDQGGISNVWKRQFVDTL